MNSPEATLSPSSSTAKRVTFNESLLLYDNGLFPTQSKTDGDAIELEDGSKGKGKATTPDPDWQPRRKNETRILGLRKKTFGIIAVVCLVIVAAVVGGAIGAIIAQKNPPAVATAPRATKTYAPFPSTARETLPVFPTKDHLPPVVTKTPAAGVVALRSEPVPQ